MATMMKVAAPQLHDFNPQDLSNTAWALATLGHADDAFVAALLEAAKLQLRDFTPQALSNTAWALAVLDHADNIFVVAVLHQARSSGPCGQHLCGRGAPSGMVLGFSAQELKQLFMCVLWLEDQNSDVAGSSAGHAAEPSN
jgi:hypothetical protein